MNYRRRKFVALVLMMFTILVTIYQQSQQVTSTQVASENASTGNTVTSGELAASVLDRLVVKGRAPKTDYRRAQFGDGWSSIGMCDMRNIILNRDMTNTVVDANCKVISGVLQDPYTAEAISFTRGANTSDLVQIDHVVALSDAWQKGAQALTLDKRIELANDPLELLAVSGKANQDKSDGDAATWLPANKPFRCQYVARQIAIKAKYNLWVTQAEKAAMQQVLDSCSEQLVPTTQG